MRSEVVSLSKSRRMGLWRMGVYVGGDSAARHCSSVGFLPYKISLCFFLAVLVYCWRMRSRVGWHSRLQSVWPAFKWMCGGSADESVYGFLPFSFGPYGAIWEFLRWFALNKSICSCEGKGGFDDWWGKLFDTTNTQIRWQFSGAQRKTSTYLLNGGNKLVLNGGARRAYWNGSRKRSSCSV